MLEGIGFGPLLSEGFSRENNLVYIVMKLHGPSLEDLLYFCGGQFSLKTTLMVFYQLLERVEWLHFNKLIHLDIKPNNIVIGRNSASNILHMIDFGLTRPYIENESGEHIKKRIL